MDDLFKDNISYDDKNVGNVYNELKALKVERDGTYTLLQSYQKSIADSLKNGYMGNEINDIVINNKKKIKISKYKQFKYKFNKIIDKIFKTL